MATPSIAMIPSGYKDGKVYSVLPNSGDGDFTFSRGSAATRVNEQGLVENVQIISSELVSNGDFSQEGSELVTNGDFATDSDWIKVSEVTISDGKAIFNNVSGGSNGLYQSSVFSANKVYKVTLEVSNYQSGNITVWSGGSQSISTNESFSGNGTKTWYISAGSTNTYLLISSLTAGTFSIDNVSVKEVAQDWSVIDGDSDNYVEFNQEQGTARLKFLNTSPLTKLQSTAQYISGKKYKLIVDVAEVVSGGIKIDAGGVQQTYNTVGVQEAIIEPTGTQFISFYRATANVDITLNSVSIKEITDATDLPRLDYSDGSCPSLLLEPQSTNLITYSEDFSNATWIPNPDITTTNSLELAPNGELDADLIEYDGSGYSFIRAVISTPSTATTLSVFAKKGNWRYLGLRQFQSSGNDHTVFDFDTETFTNIESGQTASFEVFSNGWYRIKVTQPSPEANAFVGFALTNSSGGESHTTGGQVANVHLFGAQLEQQSYATSYIPTNGAIATRLADVATNSGNSSLINSTEGVLYAEIAALEATSSGSYYITITDGTYNNRASILFSTGATNQIRTFLRVGGATQIDVSDNVSDVTDFNKIAFSYKENDFKVYINGALVSSDTNGSVWSTNTINKLTFSEIGTTAGLFKGKTKAVAVYKEALTDAELIELTTI